MSRVELSEIRDLLLSVIEDDQLVARMEASSPLFGAVPELDSIAVVGLLTGMEEQFDIIVEDDEIDESAFATLGALHVFVQGKVRVRDLGR